MSEAEQLVGKLLAEKNDNTGGSVFRFTDAFEELKQRDGGNGSEKLKSDIAETNKQLDALHKSGTLTDKDFAYSVKQIEKYLNSNLNSDISIQANIAPGVTLGKGITVSRGAVIESGAKIGDGAAIDRGVTIHHNVIVKPGASIGRGSDVGNGSVVEENADIGFGATIGQSVHIGKHTSIFGTKQDQSNIQDRAYIGDNVTVDAGATIGAHARLGDNVHVLSKAVVNRSEHIPANTVVDIRDPKVLQEIAKDKSENFFAIATYLKDETDFHNLLKPAEGESRKDCWSRVAASIKDQDLRAAFDQMSAAQDKLDAYDEKHQHKQKSKH